MKASKTKGSELTGEILGRIFENYSKILPLKTILENDHVLAFYHPKPSYKKHIIITPKKYFKDLSSLSENEVYIQEIFKAVKQLIDSEELQDKYHLVVNGGEYQNIKQVHFHLYQD